MRLLRPVAILGMLLLVTACANTGLRNLQPSGDGPDDFLVNPSKPLQDPASYSALPAPTPGQGNVVDPTPIADAQAALGGRPTDPNAGVPARDGAVVRHASRFGVAAGIRSTLASEDADFRRRKGRLTQYRLVPVDRYNQAYKKQALDARKVANAYRRAGVATPSVPPGSKKRF